MSDTHDRLIGRRTFTAGMAALGALAAPGISYAQAPAAARDAWPYLASLPPAERRRIVEREAAREGSLTIYGALGIDRAQFLTKQFNEKYPGVKVDFVRLTQTDLISRLLAEQRANQTASDLIISVTTYLDIIKGAIAPYEHSTWGDWDKRFLFGSNAAGWTSVVYELLPTTIAWRTDRGITKETAPKLLREVQDPKWKGRAGCTSQLEEFVDAMHAKYGEAEGNRQVLALAALDNQLVASNAALAESLGAGQVDMTWNFVAHRAYFLQRRGAPIDWVFMDPQFAQGVGASAVLNAPRPYAAALFMDFLLEAGTLEDLDKLEAGRLFGPLKGKYALSANDFPEMLIYRPIPAAQFRRLNAFVEENFVRRKR